MINRKVALVLLMGLLGVSLVGAVAFGTFPVSFSALLEGDLSQQQVIMAIRLPRVLLGAVVGAALAVSGAALQGLFRNPLADPGLVGISAGAALAVGFAIVFMEPFLNTLGLYGLSIAAFAGGLMTCFVIFRFAKVAGVFSVTHMLLAGIAINAIAAAGIGVLTYLSDDQQLRTLIFWTMGNLGGAFWSPLLVATTIIVPTIMVLIKNSGKLNILLLGEDEATNLGVNAERRGGGRHNWIRRVGGASPHKANLRTRSSASHTCGGFAWGNFVSHSRWFCSHHCFAGGNARRHFNQPHRRSLFLVAPNEAILHKATIDKTTIDKATIRIE